MIASSDDDGEYKVFIYWELAYSTTDVDESLFDLPEGYVIIQVE